MEELDAMIAAEGGWKPAMKRRRPRQAPKELSDLERAHLLCRLAANARERGKSVYERTWGAVVASWPPQSPLGESDGVECWPWDRMRKELR